MRTIKELAWLAGLFEGEGCFMAAKTGGHATSKTPTIAIQMIDKDIIKRVADITKVQPRNPWRSKLGNRQLVHHVTVCGTRAISWMMTLYVLLGERRRTKIREILAQWRASPRMPRASRGQRFMAICHPNRIRCGHGLCHACYMREWRRRTGRNGTYYRNAKRAQTESQATT